MKTIVLILSLFLVFPSLFAQDLKQLKKSIPHKKVKNIVVSPANENWFTFDYKEGKGLWDNDNKHVVLTSSHVFTVLPTLYDNGYLLYNDNFMGIYIPSEKEIYLTTANDSDYISFRNDRYDISYYRYRESLYCRDTLKKEVLTITRTKKDIKLKYFNHKTESFNNKIIDLATNKIVIDVDNWYMDRVAMGYSIGNNKMRAYFNHDYKRLNDSISKKELTDPIKLGKIVGCEVDTVWKHGYYDFIYSCNGKFGVFGHYEGVKLEPEYDMIRPGYMLDIVVKGNKLGGFNGESNLILSAQYNFIESYSTDFCHPYVKIDDRIFAGYYEQCEIFSGLSEVDNTDSLAQELTYENRDGLTTIIGDKLIVSRGHKSEKRNGKGGYAGGWWHSYTGTSGVYSLTKKKWIVEPYKYMIYPYGKNYIVADTMTVDGHGNFYFLDANFNKVNDQRFDGVHYFGKQMVVYDSTRLWSTVNEETLELTEMGTFWYSTLVRESNGYYIIGSRGNYYNNYQFWIGGLINADFKEVARDESFGYILSNDYAILMIDPSEFGEYQYALYDILNEETLSKWAYSEDHKDPTKITIGYGEDAEVFDITTLRK